MEGERPHTVSEFVPGPSLHAAVAEGAAFSGDRCTGWPWAWPPRWPPSTRRAWCTAT
ncbi:hypothetical protein ACIBO5_24540 [Nonomuraea angiospora]|uniref:hypothetical protein n=1 Tax=Nonomuraea angiospora TaxID=46172 RepID=UPI0037A623EB